MTARAFGGTLALAFAAACLGAVAGSILVGEPHALPPRDELLRRNALDAPLEAAACLHAGASAAGLDASAQVQLGSGCATNGAASNETANATSPPAENATSDPAENATSSPPAEGGSVADGATGGGIGEDSPSPPDGTPGAPPGAGESAGDADEAAGAAAGDAAGGDGAADATEGATSETDPTTYTHRGWVPPNPPRNDTREAALPNSPRDAGNATDKATHRPERDEDANGDAPAANAGAASGAAGGADTPGAASGAAGSSSGGGATRGAGASDAGGDGGAGALGEDAIGVDALAWRPFEPPRIAASRAADAPPHEPSACDPSCDASTRAEADAWHEKPRDDAPLAEEQRGLFARLVDSVRGYLTG